MLLTWKELQATDFGAQDWLIEDWVPAGSIVMVWGAESIGKTPVCWYMARAIGSGEPFFGWQTKQARVLFIELDMPPYYTQKRTKELDFPDTVKFFLGQEILNFREEAMIDYYAEAIEWQPEVVFIDSLRKSHPLDDKVSETPSKVYGMYKRMFPGAALVFIHHERKNGGEEDTRPDEESYSGSRAWSNNCQVGFRVSYDARQKFPLLVKCTRHQFMEKGWSKRFHLQDGWLMTIGDEEKVLAELIASHSGNELIETVMERLECSRASAYRKIKAMREDS